MSSARSIMVQARRLRHRAWWGNIRRDRPFCEGYGYDRGQPVDRVYIERFLEEFRADIRGRALELADAAYTRRFGGGRVGHVDVLDLDPHRAGVTIVGDLSESATLAGRQFDVIVLTQALHLIPSPQAALRSMYDALSPGGCILITAPALSRRALPHDAPQDLWRFTREGLHRLIELAVPEAEIEIRSYGTLTAAIATLLGLARQDLRRREIDATDPDFEVIVAARVRRRGPAPQEG